MYGNQYYNQPRYQQPMMMPQAIPQPTQSYLLGKSVDNIEVVKAMDIPLDGTISYFPLTDGSAIVTKQLQSDGTSKTVVFRPSDAQTDTQGYVTLDEVKKVLNAHENSEIDDLRDEIKDMKKQIKDIKNSIK